MKDLEFYTHFARLLNQGFTAEQATRLVVLRKKRVPEVADEPYAYAPPLLFARWLVEHGRLNEGE